jgi:hypothetical protein
MKSGQILIGKRNILLGIVLSSLLEFSGHILSGAEQQQYSRKSLDTAAPSGIYNKSDNKTELHLKLLIRAAEDIGVHLQHFQLNRKRVYCLLCQLAR